MKFEQLYKLITEDVIPVKNDNIPLTPTTLIKDYYASDIYQTERLYTRDMTLLRLTVEVFYNKKFHTARTSTIDVDLTKNITWEKVKWDIMYHICKSRDYNNKISAIVANDFSKDDSDYSRATIKLATIIT